MRARPAADSATEAARAGGRAGRGRARVGQVVLDLPPHPLDLLGHRRRELGLAGGRGAVRLVRQHRERRLEAVREIAGLGDRAAHRLLLVGEQRVQVGDERLDFGGIAPFDAAGGPALHVRQPRGADRSSGFSPARTMAKPASIAPAAITMSRCGYEWMTTSE